MALVRGGGTLRDRANKREVTSREYSRVSSYATEQSKIEVDDKAQCALKKKRLVALSKVRLFK